jgi:hypothetical protein
MLMQSYDVKTASLIKHYTIIERTEGRLSDVAQKVADKVKYIEK